MMPTSKTFRLIGYYYTVLSILVSMVLSNSFPWDNFQETSKPTCNTVECKQMTEDLHKCMKPTVDPCQDFYEYVCGNWKTTREIENYLGYGDLETILEYDGFKKLKSKLEQPIKSHEDGETIKAKQLYHQCMRLPYLERVDETVLRGHMKTHGFWWTPSKEPKTAKSWLTIHNHYLSISGESAFFQIDLRMPQDGVVPYISLQRAPTPYGTLQHTYDWQDDQRKSYFKFLEKVFKLVADGEASKFSDTFDDDLHDVFKFRLSLQKVYEQISISKEDPAISTHLKIRELSKWYNDGKGCPESGLGNINWLEFFQSFRKSDEYLSITEETKIHVHSKDYLRELCHLLTHTRLKTVVNHIHLYFMEKHIALRPDLKKLLFNSITQGLNTNGKIRYIPPQWYTCIVTHNMHTALGLLYSRSYLTESMVKETNYMIEYIKDVIKLQIEGVKWLKESAKKETIDKLNNIKFVIGFPDEKDPTISKEILQKMIETSSRPYAFYDFKGNIIFISSVYFQQPVFDKNLPFTITYAALGTLIAHEMYHMFDNKVVTMGSLHDVWGRKAGKHYSENEQCFVDYYSKLPIWELQHKIYEKAKVNSLLTREENIADVMGLKTSYNAYKKMVWTRKGICPILQEFSNISCDKLFFIAYARTFCSDIPRELFIRRLRQAKHSPNRLRVNVPVSSMPQFARAFKCEANTPMNPLARCDLWA